MATLRLPEASSRRGGREWWTAARDSGEPRKKPGVLARACGAHRPLAPAPPSTAFSCPFPVPFPLVSHALKRRPSRAALFLPFSNSQGAEYCAETVMVHAGGMHAVCGVAGCLLLFLRPLLCVFTRTELALLLAGAYGYDQWQGLVGERDAGSDARARKRPLTVVSVTREGKMTLLQGDLKLSDWRKSEGDVDSVGTASTVDDSDVSLLSLSARSTVGDDRQPEDDDASDRLSVDSSSAMVHASGRALFVTSSICMSRNSVDQLRDIVFDHARGHLELRQDAVFHLIRHWTECSVHLSVRSGHLHVHRKKSKDRYTRLQLADFTGAIVHRRRKTDFKVTFYGHKPLRFRALTAPDAELWVKALEYAKEFTWHLWAA